jgi:AraC-like DNA-binding protein
LITAAACALDLVKRSLEIYVMSRTGSFSFSDPQMYQSSIRPAQVEVVATAKGDFHAELKRAEFSKLWLQSSRVNLPLIYHTAVSAERAPIFFLANGNRAAYRYGGLDTSLGELIAVMPGSTHYSRSEASAHWATLSLSREDLADAALVLTGRELTAPSVTRRLRPSPRLMSRLLNLHEAAEKIADGPADIKASSEPARALEHALMHAMIMCMTEGSPVEVRSGARQHLAVLARFEDFVAANETRPLYLSEICAAVGASGRMLRMCCQEHLGMGPVRYLWLRRMHLARGALVEADPLTATVTRIAMDYGFWELGRFAVRFRELFGESPSASLLRPRQEGCEPKIRPLALPFSETA